MAFILVNDDKAPAGDSPLGYILNPEHIPAELEPFRGRLSPHFFEVRKKIIEFVKEDVIPMGPSFNAQLQEGVNKVVHSREPLPGEDPAYARHPVWAPSQPPILHELRQKAKARGLYNFFLPEVGNLSVLEYAPIAEIFGVFGLANIAMNCSAPDTGNMEVLEKYGTPEQKKQWLEPLLEGGMRSAYAMTEPGVASSDATNISTTIRREGNEYVINGQKWYISGACRPECKIMILLGRSGGSSGKSLHSAHSMILVPRESKGVTIVRPLAVFGHVHDHAEIIFDDVRVPVANMLLGEGRGFEIAQGRLGPGRIHHCMRTIGTAEQALDAIIHRAHNRVAFGKVLANQATIRQAIAEARMEITKSRLLCYLAAVQADEYGFKATKAYIAMTKVDAPRMCLKIIDEAIQVHGAHGVSQDSQLSDIYTNIRTIRLADGPDIVHLNTIAKEELKRKTSVMGAMVSGTNKNIEKYGKFKNVTVNTTARF
jgi:alkylation response protein AidB-like acyl-CoA dehydrogenase